MGRLAGNEAQDPGLHRAEVSGVYGLGFLRVEDFS